MSEDIRPTKDEEDAAWVVRSSPTLAAKTLARLNAELAAERERADRLEQVSRLLRIEAGNAAAARKEYEEAWRWSRVALAVAERERDEARAAAPHPDTRRLDLIERHRIDVWPVDGGFTAIRGKMHVGNGGDVRAAIDAVGKALGEEI